MNYCESQEKFDEIIEDKGEVIFSGIFSGVKVVVDSKAIMVLIGTEMDYVEDDIKAEFVFKNPNEKVYFFNDSFLGLMWMWRKFPYLTL